MSATPQPIADNLRQRAERLRADAAELEAIADRLDGSTTGVERIASPIASLDATDGEILRTLADAGRWLLVVDLAERADCSARTCSRRLPALIDAGYVKRREGRTGSEGRGVTITDAGRAICPLT